MADNNFRPFRSRDTLAREDVDPTSDAARDPLAELARIIGQSNRVNDFDRDPRHDPGTTWCRRWTNRCRQRRTAIGRPMTATPSRTRRSNIPSNIRINTRKKTTFSRGCPSLIRPIAPMSDMTATTSVRRRSPANIPSRPSPTTIPTMTRGRMTRAIATRSRRAPPAGSRLWRRNLWRRNPMTTNTKPKTNGTTRRIASRTTPKTMPMTPRPGLGAAASSWFWPCWAWS